MRFLRVNVQRARRAWPRVVAVTWEAALDALAVLAPGECAGCGVADRALCPECRRCITARVDTRVLDDGTVTFTGLPYEGAVQGAMLAFKKHGRTDVATALSAPLAAAIEAAVSATSRDSVELVTVPAARLSFRRRGYDPVALLLRKRGLVSARGVLVFAREHAQQKSLGREARQRNLADSMFAPHALHGRVFIVIDDVVTTGATIMEATRALRAAGAEVLGAAAVANTVRLLGDSGGSPCKLVTSPVDGTTVSKRGAQVNPGSAGGDAPR